MVIIIQEQDFDKLYNIYIKNKHIQMINYKPIISITKKLKVVHED